MIPSSAPIVEYGRPSACRLRSNDIACRRISEATKQPDLFIEKPKPIKQEALDLS